MDRRITPQDKFIKIWENTIQSMTEEDLKKWISETSPHHPNENMRWLYDRIINEIAFRG